MCLPFSSSELSAFSSDLTNISAYEQSYVFLGEIVALTTTSTKYGISSKDLISKPISVNENHLMADGHNLQLRLPITKSNRFRVDSSILGDRTGKLHLKSKRNSS